MNCPRTLSTTREPVLACLLFLATLLNGWTSQVLASQTLTLAIAMERPPDVTMMQWQGLTDHLATQLDDTRVRLGVMTPDEIKERLARQTIDILITDAGQYESLRRQNPLTALLATVVRQQDGTPLIGTGGVIVALTARDDIHDLHDLPGKRIAGVHTSSLGGYQAQMKILAEHGIEHTRLGAVELLGRTHDEVVAAVLEGRVDAGFVRSGLIEAMISEGRLTPALLKVLNPQVLPGYPHAVSTRLYPESPVLAAAHVPPDLARRVAAALMMLESDHPATHTAGIAGFAPATDYAAVEGVLRDLRLPPYDLVPEVRLSDVWARHRVTLLFAATSLVLVLALAVVLARTNLRLRADKLRLEQMHASLAASDHRNRETLATLERTLHELENERARLGHIIWATGACTWEWDIPSGEIRINARWAEFVGYQLNELLPTTLQTWESFVHPDDLPTAKHALQQHLCGSATHYESQYRLRRRDGTICWVLDRGRIVAREPDGTPLRVVGTHMDIHQLKAQEDALRRLAHYDPLTGLPNRRLLSDRIAHAIARCSRAGTELAVCFLDLDTFKPINDRYGHEAGDRVLIEISRRLQRSLRTTDSIARLGGDEFALLFDDLTPGAEDLGPMLDRLLAAVVAPIKLDNAVVAVSASIGVALFPHHGQDEDSLLQMADESMYAAKEMGRNRYRLSPLR